MSEVVDGTDWSWERDKNNCYVAKWDMGRCKSDGSFLGEMMAGEGAKRYHCSGN